MLGRNLEATITKAEDIKKEWKDDFTSVEHLVLAMLDDPRFGRKLLKDAGLNATKLTQAIKDIRGGNRVQDQVSVGLRSKVWHAQTADALCHFSSLSLHFHGFSWFAVPYKASCALTMLQFSLQDPEGKYEALHRYARDLTAAAREGKLDPVIGRDDEIRRCIQILSRRTKNNPVLIGEPGVGKTAVAEGAPLRCRFC